MFPNQPVNLQGDDRKPNTGMPTRVLEGCEAQSSLGGLKQVNAMATCELTGHRRLPKGLVQLGHLFVVTPYSHSPDIRGDNWIFLFNNIYVCVVLYVFLPSARRDKLTCLMASCSTSIDYVKSKSINVQTSDGSN